MHGVRMPSRAKCVARMERTAHALAHPPPHNRLVSTDLMPDAASGTGGNPERSAAMRKLIYVLRFRGEAKRIGSDGNVLATATSAPGCTIGTGIGPEGVSGSLQPVVGDEATLESEWVFTGATTFQEAGTIAFGQGGHRLRFSTFGSAHLAATADDACRHGSAIRLVEGGEGQFAGASGLIASVFCLRDGLTVIDHQIGVLLVP